jgi:hypothetical protein
MRSPSKPHPESLIPRLTVFFLEIDRPTHTTTATIPTQFITPKLGGLGACPHLGKPCLNIAGAECAPLPETLQILGAKSRKPNPPNGLVGARIPRPQSMPPTIDPIDPIRLTNPSLDRHPLKQESISLPSLQTQRMFQGFINLGHRY